MTQSGSSFSPFQIALSHSQLEQAHFVFQISPSEAPKEQLVRFISSNDCFSSSKAQSTAQVDPRQEGIINQGDPENIFGSFTSPSGQFMMSFQTSSRVFGLDFNVTWFSDGYVGIGWSDRGAFHLSHDMLIFYVDEEGILISRDSFSINTATPDEDFRNDIVNPSYIQENGATSVFFSRAFNSQDTQDTPIRGTPQTFFWAINSNDDIQLEHNIESERITINFIGNDLDFPNDRPTNPEGGSFSARGFRSSWRFLGSNEIEFTIECDGTGWVSIGWSSSSDEHTNADMVLFLALQLILPKIPLSIFSV